MAQFKLSLAVFTLSVLVSALAGGRWNQLGGGRPGFGQVGFSEGRCSAIEGVLPDPKSGCCGKHAEADGSSPDENNNGADRGDNTGDDFDNGYGPGGDNHEGFGPVIGDDDDFDFGNGNGFDFGNGIGDFDFGPWQFNGEDRYRNKRSADKNDSDVAPDKFITAGKPAGLYQYPWLVHLTVKVQEMMDTKMIGCGGSLLSSRHVITAAHCVDFEIRNMEDVSVYLAEYNTRTYPNDCVGRNCIKNMIIHPDKILKHSGYQRDALRNDIALMRLSKSAPYTDSIRPICLPAFNINTAKYEGTPLTVTGWGQTEYRQPSSVKLHTQVALVAPSSCRRHYPDITEGQLCAAGKSGQDTCMGDSGGPIMAERDGTFYIVGLVSGKRQDAGCGSPVPTMYTNVFSYTKWIQNFIRN